MVDIVPIQEIRPRLSDEFQIGDFTPRTEAIAEAYQWGNTLHDGQLRLTGESYFETHCVWVAAFIDNLVNKEAWTIAALLHDTVEDQGENLDEIREKFPGPLGEEIANIVDGVTKLVVSREGRSRELETLRKIAMFRDPAVFLVKLADKSHNIMTLEHMPDHKRIAKAEEAIRAYGRLAGVMNCYKWRRWLEDMAFPFAEPETFYEIQPKIDGDPRLQVDFINSMMKQLGDIMDAEGVDGRVDFVVNGYWQAWQKLWRMARMRKTSLDTFAHVNDLVSFRLIVGSDDERQCYRLLAGVNRFLGPYLDQDRFDDYIACPQHGYRALQSTAWLSDYGAVEVAIATQDMEDENLWGVVHAIRQGRDVSEYRPVTILTPTAGLRFVSEGSTVLDAVASIQHEFFLDKISSVKVNDCLARLSDKVKPGDVVEVISEGKRMIPCEEWLSFCNRTTARLLRVVLATEQLRRAAALGCQQIKTILGERGVLDLGDVVALQSDKIDLVMMQLARANLQDLYAAVGGDAIRLVDLAEALDEAGITKKDLNWVTLHVEGAEQVNKPGVLATLTGLVSAEGGNILRMVNNTLPDGGFTVRFVMQVFTPGFTENLLQALNNCDIEFSILELV